jgi:hypothetical protein
MALTATTIMIITSTMITTMAMFTAHIAVTLTRSLCATR